MRRIIKPIIVAALLAWAAVTAPAQTNTAGYALSFNGTNQDVTVASQPALDAYPLTIMAWVNTTQTNPAGIVTKYVSVFDGYQLYLDDRGHVGAWYYGGSAADSIYGNLDGGAVNDGLWHHVAFAVDAAGGHLYVDGALKSMLPWTGVPAATTTTQPLNFGLFSGTLPEGVTGYFAGELDEISLWNVALYTPQIQLYMNHRLTGAESHLLGYWRFDEGAGATAGDSTGHGYVGTLNGGPAWPASSAPIGPAGLPPFNTNWTISSANNGPWSGSVMSAAGATLVAVNSNGLRNVSSNYGLSWASTAVLSTNCFSIAGSGDCTKLIIGSMDGGVYTSMDSGVTWTLQTSLPSGNWYAMASSDDGHQFVACRYGTAIYISTNYGTNWNDSGAPHTNWSKCASSADGATLVASVSGGGIYTSTNAGQTWSPPALSPQMWTGLASSADGLDLVASAYNGIIYYSTNAGGSWTPSDSLNTGWESVASSADGSRVLALSSAGFFLSTNYGAHWTSLNSPAGVNWEGFNLSADGAIAVGLGAAGPIFTTAVPPSLSAILSSGQLQLSWPLSPSGFNLWQSAAVNPTNWVAATNPVTVLPGRNQTAISPSGAGLFFRLQTQ